MTLIRFLNCSMLVGAALALNAAVGGFGPVQTALTCVASQVLGSGGGEAEVISMPVSSESDCPDSLVDWRLDTPRPTAC